MLACGRIAADVVGGRAGSRPAAARGAGATAEEEEGCGREERSYYSFIVYRTCKTCKLAASFNWDRFLRLRLL
jgi:hypothetical protein